MLLASPLAVAVEHVVSIGPGFNYNPVETVVQPGDTVRFSATLSHPLRSDDQSFGCNQTCTVAFAQPGTQAFYCPNHGGAGGLGMSGRIVVMQPGAIHADGFEGDAP